MRTILWLGVAALGLAAPARADAPPCNCPMNCPMNNQAGMRGGGWSGGAYARMYDPKTVETIRGEITAIHRVSPMRGMSEGIHALVKTDKGEVEVQLGPAWYLDNQETQLAAGDRVEIKGSRTTVADKPALIAAEVKKGSERLLLRDERGLPLWRGWR